MGLREGRQSLLASMSSLLTFLGKDPTRLRVVLWAEEEEEGMPWALWRMEAWKAAVAKRSRQAGSLNSWNETELDEELRQLRSVPNR
jgi:hypothetical protein